MDFEHPVLNPVPLFIDMLLRAHRIKFLAKTFCTSCAEAETLDKVTENINLVASLNRMQGVEAALTCRRSWKKKAMMSSTTDSGLPLFFGY